MTTHQDIRNKFIKFFTSAPRSHKEIPSAPLVPDNDPTVLFITAGMHPLVPYLLGEPHPLGTRLANIQKSLRTDDIDEVGDQTHNTFFEMLGNWSLGDYFKKEAIEWSFDFLTNKQWLGLDPKQIYVTVFEGDKDAPRDEESIRIWKDVYKQIGITATVGDAKKGVVGKARIFPYPKSKNWWGPAGQTGPCGPDTEMFFDTKLDVHDPKKYGKRCHVNCDCGRYIEIWNDVFMEFNKKSDGTFEYLKQKNVDTGLGMERVVAIKEWLAKRIPDMDPFHTELFSHTIHSISELSGKAYQGEYKSHMRIIADHLRASCFALADGVIPSNKERGYILRRLIRRAVRHAHTLGIQESFLSNLSLDVIKNYQDQYPELLREKETILSTLQSEELKFRSTLKRGLKELEKHENINGKVAFDLYQSYGFPWEMTVEIAHERGQTVDKKRFEKEFKKHQDLSRTATKGVFAGGLQDHSEETTKLHTATHLLHQALRSVLGTHAQQKGSNITAERLRFDFSHEKKLTEDEIKQVTNLINEKIQDNLPVSFMITTYKDAIEQGALAFFGERYPEKVKVYTIGDPSRGHTHVFSKEICGGPHVDFTGRLGSFTIVKEEALGSQTRRIYAKVSPNRT